NPIQHIGKHAEVESKIEYVNQLRASQYPPLGVQRESLGILAGYYQKANKNIAPMSNLDKSPKTPNGRDNVSEWVTHVSDCSDETVVPAGYISALQSTPNSLRQASNTPRPSAAISSFNN